MAPHRPDHDPDSQPAGTPVRRRMILAGGVLAGLAVLGASAAALVGTGPRPDSAPSPNGPAGGSPNPGPSTASPRPSPTPEPGADITGPLNLLIAGVDTRVSVPGWVPHADAVLLLHITGGLDRGYLFALPRDLVVDIPPFPRARFAGQRTKLTHAMSYGSRVPGKPAAPDPVQGFQLLTTTVSRYTGIKRFDAGAVLTFGGFDKLVDAVGGVDLYIDQRVVSMHRRPDGRHRTPGPGPGGYVGPQMVYEKGNRHLTGWQALDYARQRYTTGGAYARQRHQQQLIKAILVRVASQNLARDPDRVEQIVRALGKALIFTGGGRREVDFAFALSQLRPEALTLVALPGAAVGRGGGYRGEQLTQLGTKFIAELRAGRAEAFLAANPALVIRK